MSSETKTKGRRSGGGQGRWRWEWREIDQMNMRVQQREIYLDLWELELDIRPSSLVYAMQCYLCANLQLKIEVDNSAFKSL